MKKKLITLFGIVAMMLVMVIPAQAAPGTNRGYSLNGTGYDGLHAIVSTMTGLGTPFAFNVKSPDVYQMFESSQIRPKNSCLSVNVRQEKVNAAAPTTHQAVIAKWCTGGSQSGTLVYDITNATFASKYVRTGTYNDTGTAFQDNVLEFRVIQTYVPTNQWSAYVYNNTTATYDLMATVSGSTGGFNDGWVDVGDGGYTQDTTTSCPNLSIMQLRAIQKRVSGTWSNIASGDITANIADTWNCITNLTYKDTRTIPYQFKVLPFANNY